MVRAEKQSFPIHTTLITLIDAIHMQLFSRSPKVACSTNVIIGCLGLQKQTPHWDLCGRRAVSSRNVNSNLILNRAELMLERVYFNPSALVCVFCKWNLSSAVNIVRGPVLQKKPTWFLFTNPDQVMPKPNQLNCLNLSMSVWGPCQPCKPDSHHNIRTHQLRIDIRSLNKVFGTVSKNNRWDMRPLFCCLSCSSYPQTCNSSAVQTEIHRTKDNIRNVCYVYKPCYGCQEKPEN